MKAYSILALMLLFAYGIGKAVGMLINYLIALIY
jgi:hypothetical protein